MPLELKDVVSLIARNMESKGNPLGVDVDTCVSWASGLDLDKGGETILYTSCMYQMVPYIVRFTELLERFEGGAGGGLLLKIGKSVSSVVDADHIARVPKSERDRFNGVLRGIAKLLKLAKVDFGYLYEDEPYSGSLLYELGLEGLFSRHARRVVDTFRRFGVRRVIVVDPHTYYVLGKVYPRYVDMGDLEVIHYIDMLYRYIDRIPLKEIKEEKYTIHDPCLLARFMKIIDPQRELLDRLNIDLVEPQRSRIKTRCCGGPLESVSPKLSKTLGRVRVSELAGYSRKIIAMCPICISNLVRGGRDLDIEVYDLSEILVRGAG